MATGSTKGAGALRASFGVMYVSAPLIRKPDQTDRLILRPWRDSDLPLFAEQNADPVVMRYLVGPLTREESDAYVARSCQDLAEAGICKWAVEAPGVAPFIGCRRTVPGAVRGIVHAGGRGRVAAAPELLGSWLRDRGGARGDRRWVRAGGIEGGRCPHGRPRNLPSQRRHAGKFCTVSRRDGVVERSMHSGSSRSVDGRQTATSICFAARRHIRLRGVSPRRGRWRRVDSGGLSGAAYASQERLHRRDGKCRVVAIGDEPASMTTMSSTARKHDSATPKDDRCVAICIDAQTRSSGHRRGSCWQEIADGTCEDSGAGDPPRGGRRIIGRWPDAGWPVEGGRALTAAAMPWTDRVAWLATGPIRPRPL